MILIALSQEKFAKVDDSDAERLNLFKWYAKESSTSWYAVRMKGLCNYSIRGRRVKRSRKRETIRMHNVIMKSPEGMIVHHKDGNGLNNQRDNLELCTDMENTQEAVKKRDAKQEV